MKSIVLLLLVISFTFAQQEDYTLNFVNESLEKFVKRVSEITGKNILIYDESLKSKRVNLVSARPVNKEMIYRIFLSVIQYNGYIAQFVGENDSQVVLKLKTASTGSAIATRTIFAKEELVKYADKDIFITMVIRLQHISAREVQTTLRAMRIVDPQSGNLGGITSSNTILVTDFAPNVKRIYDIITLMDRPGPQKEVRVLPLKYANAKAVVEFLSDLATEKKRNASPIGANSEDVKLSADERLNAVVVQGYPVQLENMALLVQQLDSNVINEPSRLHYVRVKHVDAKELEETLTKLVEKTNLSKKDEDVTLAFKADSHNNGLIVRAEERVWQEISKVIQEIDVRKPQVLVEAALVEVSPKDILGLGVELFYAEENNDGDVTFGGGSNFGFSNLVAVNGNTASPIDPNNAITADKLGKLPAIRDPFQRAGTFFANYDDLFTLPILLNAIQTKVDTRLVSLPHIVTNDKSPARLKVSNSQPSIADKVDDSGAFVQSFGGFEEAGTILLVTPHISGENNSVRLELSQTVEAFDAASNAAGGIQAKTTRQINTTVHVPDGQTVAIGGLTFEQDTVTVEKIPLLGDLPLIGFLFQTRVVTHNKQGVYLFVTARVLKDEEFEDYKKISHETKLEVSEFGVDMELIDPSFVEYQKKYGLSEEDPEPFYILEYQSPRVPSKK